MSGQLSLQVNEFLFMSNVENELEKYRYRRSPSLKYIFQSRLESPTPTRVVEPPQELTPAEEINDSANVPTISLENPTPSQTRENSTISIIKTEEINASTTSIARQEATRPWFIWIISIIHVSIFILELLGNTLMTTRPIETDLSSNPLIGPNTYVLINIGACFSLCMHTVDGVTTKTNSTAFPCPNSSPVKTSGCTLSNLCGFNGVSGTPNQWFRFITASFLHSGLIHIGFNLFIQLVVGAQMEKKIGIVRMIIIYFISGVFGFILGGNFSPYGLARVGCSGSLFGIMAISLLDLMYNWKRTNYPVVQLIIHLFDIIVSFVLGLLPAIDNFSHVGGFFMGLLLGLGIMGSPVNIRKIKRPDSDDRPKSEPSSRKGFKAFFKDRPKAWWAWWIVRFIAFATAITLFVLFTESFYSGRITCSWCQYISCLPVNGWCDLGKMNTT